MKKFFSPVSEWTIGCDPGPAHCAFALVHVDEAVDFAYAPNDALAQCRTWEDFVQCLDAVAVNCSWAKVRDPAFALEKCGARFGMSGNALLFETCMAAGVVRAIAMRGPAPETTFAFSPSDWRYVLVGKGGAKDANVRDVLLTLLPECDTLVRQCSKESKVKMSLTKPITSHLRDALGVALATGFVEYRTGKPVYDFPMWTEVRCG